MNKEINQNIKCNQCKKDFPKQDVYRIGIKQKKFFCRECANNIKSCCMWCGKELAKKHWRVLGGGSGIKSEEGKLAESIDYDNHRKEKHHLYYLVCEETREHGIRPNQSCPSRFSNWWVNKKNQKHQGRKDQGWKECAGKGVYHKNPETGEVEFDFDCCELVPPGQKYCGEDRCVYYTAVYKNEHSEARKRIADKWNRRKQEKYRRANEWWNSLSLAEKQAELKAEKTRLKRLGLQRQRCWIENLDKNSILFENDKLYYDNMDKIPPSFLHRFGLPGFQWENVWKNDDNQTSSLQAVKSETVKKTSGKEVSLAQAKKDGKTEQIAELEQQIKELKSRQEKNSTNEVMVKPTVNYAPWIICGIGTTLLIGIGLIIWKKRKN